MQTSLLSVNGAAEFLGVAPVTIRRAVREKFLTHIRIGDRILFRPEDLDAFIKGCTVSAERSPSLREKQSAASAARRVLRASQGAGNE